VILLFVKGVLLRLTTKIIKALAVGNPAAGVNKKANQ
jgi:hypothetical protein